MEAFAQEELIAHVRTVFDSDVSQAFCCTEEEADEWLSQADQSVDLEARHEIANRGQIGQSL